MAGPWAAVRRVRERRVPMLRRVAGAAVRRVPTLRLAAEEPA
ncbi:hypothetical protein [Actinophytocola sediminis]